jgi:hypothetical protein
VAEAGDDVVAEFFEVVEGLREESVPETSRLSILDLAALNKKGLVFAGCNDLSGDIFWKFGDEDGVGKLLEQDGREIQVAVETNSVSLQVCEEAKKREVGLCGGFVEPLHSMRPGPMIDDVGEMGVQGEGKKTLGP